MVTGASIIARGRTTGRRLRALRRLRREEAVQRGRGDHGRASSDLPGRYSHPIFDQAPVLGLDTEHQGREKVSSDDRQGETERGSGEAAAREGEVEAPGSAVIPSDARDRGASIIEVQGDPTAVQQTRAGGLPLARDSRLLRLPEHTGQAPRLQGEGDDLRPS